MERIFVTNFSGLQRIFRRFTSNQCDAARAADHDDILLACQISSYVSKRKKTVPKCGNLQEILQEIQKLRNLENKFN
jgi:hypothetical protein